MDAIVKTTLGAIVALALSAAPANANSRYTECGAIGEAAIVAVTAASCQEVREVASAVTAAPPDQAPALLGAAGWTALRATPTSDRGAHDLVAARGFSALRIRRAGAAPDLDGWAAGRELIFSRNRLVGGARVPRDSVVCTSAFLIRLGRHTGGLSAAHCGGVRTDGTTHRRNAALRRPPLAGIVLGRVQRNVARNRPLDALVVPVPAGANRPSTPIVDRGVARPPWFVVGPARPTSNRRVCYTGRTSGVDQCGAILAGSSARRVNSTATRVSGTRVICTSIPARQGDSGGPVYTAPRTDGTVHAIGITTLVVGPFQSMCFTPIAPVLDALNATLVRAVAR
ncbi:MAG: hypothetical protein Q8O56_04835 [Solirubrobacteraceae bacterium]|nr:hypothetical protein [Solirubrobacteraceae bacterium]